MNVVRWTQDESADCHLGRPPQGDLIGSRLDIIPPSSRLQICTTAQLAGNAERMNANTGPISLAHAPLQLDTVESWLLS